MVGDKPFVGLHIIFKLIFVFTTEIGNLNTDPVAKELEILRVSAVGDEVVERDKSLLEVNINSPVLAVVQKGRGYELEIVGEGEESCQHIVFMNVYSTLFVSQSEVTLGTFKI